MERIASPDEIVMFWREAGETRWFARDDAFDALCRGRFMASYQRAAAGDLSEWEMSAEGALALLILLDQLPRNMFRGDRRSWATDAPALLVAERAIAKGFDREVEPDLQRFFYLPFMHSEDLAAQDRSVALYAAHGNPDGLKWAHHHRDIVARFGRFPHRNEVLGRKTTPEEEAFLKEDAFRG